MAKCTSDLFLGCEYGRACVSFFEFSVAVNVCPCVLGYLLHHDSSLHKLTFLHRCCQRARHRADNPHDQVHRWSNTRRAPAGLPPVARPIQPYAFARYFKVPLAPTQAPAPSTLQGRPNSTLSHPISRMVHQHSTACASILWRN